MGSMFRHVIYVVEQMSYRGSVIPYHTCYLTKMRIKKIIQTEHESGGFHLTVKQKIRKNYSPATLALYNDLLCRNVVLY
jgi:hypothetical protein